MTSAPQPSDEIIARWRLWAKQAAGWAAMQDSHGERFDASLKRARGRVRSAAADLLGSTPDRHDAAEHMMQHAIRHSVRTVPLIGFDQAAVNYTRARTWQACAWELNPELPEVQPVWPSP